MSEKKKSKVSGATKAAPVTPHTKAPSGPRASGSFRSLPPKFPSGDAPAAVSTAAAREVSFNGDLLRGVKMRIMEPLTTIGSFAGSSGDPKPEVAGGYVAGFSNTGSTNGFASSTYFPYVMALNPCAMPMYTPTSTTWGVGVAFPDSAWLQKFGSAFSRYRVTKYRLHYKPTFGTASNDRILLTYTDDPAHSLVGVTEFASSYMPTAGTMLAQPSCVAFSPWQSWSLECPVDLAVRYSILNGVYAIATIETTYPSAELRHTCFGAICCMSTWNPASRADRIFGELYHEIEIEFHDSAPWLISDTLPQFIRVGGRVRALVDAKTEAKDKETKEAPSSTPPRVDPSDAPSPCDETDDYVSPPAFVPAPSAVPGGSAYRPAAAPPVSVRTPGRR